MVRAYIGVPDFLAIRLDFLYYLIYCVPAVPTLVFVVLRLLPSLASFL